VDDLTPAHPVAGIDEALIVPPSARDPLPTAIIGSEDAIVPVPSADDVPPSTPHRDIGALAGTDDVVTVPSVDVVVALAATEHVVTGVADQHVAARRPHLRAAVQWLRGLGLSLGEDEPHRDRDDG
jgi:hypothetical protein